MNESRAHARAALPRVGRAGHSKTTLRDTRVTDCDIAALCALGGMQFGQVVLRQ